MGRREKKRRKGLKFQRKEVELNELRAILERAKSYVLNAEEHGKLTAAIDTLVFLTQELEAKGASIRRLRKLIFGASTEKTNQVLGKLLGEGTGSGIGPAEAKAAGASEGPKKTGEGSKKKPKGHGRNGASAYHGAEKVKVSHETLTPGNYCPCCEQGKVYLQTQPKVLVRVKGMAPLSASVYELDRFRCNLCGEVFTADAPKGVGDEKYDETAAGMIGLLKYGCGLPFNRLERLEESLGIPLPASTQWEVVKRASELLVPAYSELVRQAAQGEVVHNDDTTMKILDLNKPQEQDPASGEKKDERKGVYTSGIVSLGNGNCIAVFFTGRRHAGENLGEVLAQRAVELGPPIQMCDALSHNTAGEFETIISNCIAHARRRFVEVAENFPGECREVLEPLAKVYHYDAQARERGMSPEERLRFHQEHSGPLMEGLSKWLLEQFEQRKVEPNSGLGQAIAYMRKHWKKLMLFLHEPGAPLDNNICERALKKAILHRKNALFYKTENGARVGDLFMSLIHTAELSQANPFDYLVALQRHHEEVADNPSQWMPWNYREREKVGSSGPDPP